MTPHELPETAHDLYYDILRAFDDICQIECTSTDFVKGYFANSLTLVLSQYTITTGDPNP